MIPSSNNINTAIAVRRGQYPSKTWVIDRLRGRIVKQCDGFDAILQCVQKILLTDRYSEQIYSTFYGIEITDMIGKPSSYVRAALPQAVKEALKQDDRIKDVTVENIEVSGDSVSFTVNVTTNLGTVSSSESISL